MATQPSGATVNWSQVEILSSPDKGRGVFAKEPIKSQSRIHLEKPIIDRTKFKDIKTDAKVWLESWRKCIRGLSQSDLARIEELTYVAGVPERYKQNAYKYHGAQLSDEEATVMARFAANVWSGKLYLGISMWNHDCEPNCYLRRVGTSDFHEIITRCDVKAGDELSLNYLEWGLSRQTRQELTLAIWGFLCLCWTCTGPLSADQELMAKQNMAEIAGTNHRKEYGEVLP